MTDYFHRRNRPPTEYSGHEEVSAPLRSRIAAIVNEFVRDTTGTGYSLRHDEFSRRVHQQLLTPNYKEVLAGDTHDYFFTVVEVLYDYSQKLHESREEQCQSELEEAFRLSGSVYQLKRGRVTLIPSEATAKKLTEAEAIFLPYDSCYKTFFVAVGDLMGRKRKADDIVKDLFIGVEGYLKAVTGENDYGAAVKALGKHNILNAIQRSIMDKLYGYRSDASGAAHAGNTEAPTEIDSLWFLETMLAQLTLIERKVKVRKGR